MVLNLLPSSLHFWLYYSSFFLILILYCYSITVVCLFSPSHHPTPANPTSLPHLYRPSWFCPSVLYSSSSIPLSPLPPPHSPLAIFTMFIAAQFTIAKYWKQPKCPSANEWIKKLWYIYTMELYAAERKKELIPFAIAWMELESIMLSEISQAVRDKYHMISPLTGI